MVRGGGGGGGVPPWGIALIVLSSSALAGVLLLAAGYAVQAVVNATNTRRGRGAAGAGGGGDSDGDERQPLLIRIDADDAGSVGSEDTASGGWGRVGGGGWCGWDWGLFVGRRAILGCGGGAALGSWTRARACGAADSRAIAE